MCILFLYRDVIHNGENGFVCSDTEEFVKAIKEARNGADRFTERAYQDVLNYKREFTNTYR